MSYMIVAFVVNIVCTNPFNLGGISVTPTSYNTDSHGCSCVNSSRVEFTDDKERMLAALKAGDRVWKLGLTPTELLLKTDVKYSVEEKQ